MNSQEKKLQDKVNNLTKELEQAKETIEKLTKENEQYKMQRDSLYRLYKNSENENTKRDI